MVSKAFWCFEGCNSSFGSSEIDKIGGRHRPLFRPLWQRSKILPPIIGERPTRPEHRPDKSCEPDEVTYENS